jgi:HK97 family phage prohead protease
MNQEQRAYSLFEVKAIDDGRRRFSGWATTPATDRVGDTINPMGVRFKNPLVLLHQHNHNKPIGRADFKRPTAKGIEFDAEIPVVDEDTGELKSRVDTAWGEVKHGLIRAVSVGFRPLKWAYRDDGGIDFEEIECFELSIVSVPALPEAVITSVKSMVPSLSRDVVSLIRRHDDAVRRGAVPLIVPNGRALPKGAVALVR